MGILDDAIREHLDLKRRLGADDDELARLEGEAFGPATRPGEPDFPDTDEAARAAAATGEEPAAPVAEAPQPAAVEPQPTVEAETLAPEPQAAEAPATEDAVPLARELRAITEPQESAPPTVEPEPASRHPARRRPRSRPRTSSTWTSTSSSMSPSRHPRSLSPSPTPEPEPRPSTPRRRHRASSRRSSRMDTVEHHFEGAIEDTGDIEVVEGEIAEEPPSRSWRRTIQVDDEAEDDEDDEDVLEETPEFLRDQPEDDELWFEQGSPKDFDF